LALVTSSSLLFLSLMLLCYPWDRDRNIERERDREKGRDRERERERKRERKREKKREEIDFPL